MVKILLKGARLVLLTFAVVLVVVPAALARPEYAKKEGQKCNYCHLDSAKNPRNFRGIYYKLNNFSFKDFDNVAEAKLAGAKPDALGNDAAVVGTSYPVVKIAPVLNFTVKDRTDPSATARAASPT